MSLTWIEVLWWYDWISHRVDEEWNKLSRMSKLPMFDNELCKYWKIYTVEQIWDYKYKIINERDDILPS